MRWSTLYFGAAVFWCIGRVTTFDVGSLAFASPADELDTSLSPLSSLKYRFTIKRIWMNGVQVQWAWHRHNRPSFVRDAILQERSIREIHWSPLSLMGGRRNWTRQRVCIIIPMVRVGKEPGSGMFHMCLLFMAFGVN